MVSAPPPQIPGVQFSIKFVTQNMACRLRIIKDAPAELIIVFPYLHSIQSFYSDYIPIKTAKMNAEIDSLTLHVKATYQNKHAGIHELLFNKLKLPVVGMQENKIATHRQ